MIGDPEAEPMLLQFALTLAKDFQFSAVIKNNGQCIRFVSTPFFMHMSSVSPLG